MSANNAMKIEEENDGHRSRRQAICPRLHVCPRCFAYTPNPLHYVTHVKHHCPLVGHVSLSQNDKKRASPTPSAEYDGGSGVPRSAIKVYDHEGFAVWEVDGDVEKLYCQNLSLFGKLFLEQKSVFFDVGGFMYYVLTYTPPPGTSVAETTKSSPKKAKEGPRKRKHDDSTKPTDPENWIQALHTGPQTLGFFSKEKLSWDSNNLACIVIFPPYQHRSLGKLLMSVSYKLSGWEWEGGVIGGPEKPLSAMGKKSYSRFWEERVARYLLGESRDADGRRILDRVSIAKRKPKKEPNKKKREVLTVREIGERTGMLAEDVVVALVGMGVCEQVGRKSSTKKALETTNGENKSQPAASENEKEIPINLNIKKSKVLDWAKKNGLEFENPVAEEGFLGEWALSDENSDVDMDEEEDEDEESSE